MFKTIISLNKEVIEKEIRSQLLSMFVRIEKELKVRSKAISYLLRLYGEDLTQMLQYYVEISEPKESPVKNDILLPPIDKIVSPE